MIADREYAQQMHQVIDYLRQQYGDDVITRAQAEEGLRELGFSPAGEKQEEGQRFEKDSLAVCVNETFWLNPEANPRTGNKRFARLTFFRQDFQPYIENLAAERYSIIPSLESLDAEQEKVMTQEKTDEPDNQEGLMIRQGISELPPSSATELLPA